MKSLLNKRIKSKNSKEFEDWPKEYLEIVSCPICFSKKNKKLYPKKYKRIVKCANCGLIYTNPRLKKKYLKHLYSEDYFRNNKSAHFGYENYLGDENKILTTFNSRIEDIEENVAKGRLLDVGCATGFFMKAAKDRGWVVEGNEISKFASDYAKKNYKFSIFNEDFLNLPVPKIKYDLITMWDVIEHFYDPISAVKKASNLLNPDGMLVISTPDVNSIPAKITKDKWIGYKLSDEHLTYFSSKTISALLKSGGFEIVKKKHIGKHVSIPMIADRASIYNNKLGYLIRKTQFFFPKKYFLYVNPFDIMCIYAKKAG